jgi:hypothetical protein
VWPLQSPNSAILSLIRSEAAAPAAFDGLAIFLLWVNPLGAVKRSPARTATIQPPVILSRRSAAKNLKLRSLIAASRNFAPFTLLRDPLWLDERINQRDTEVTEGNGESR